MEQFHPLLGNIISQPNVFFPLILITKGNTDDIVTSRWLYRSDSAEFCHIQSSEKPPTIRSTSVCDTLWSNYHITQYLVINTKIANGDRNITCEEKRLVTHKCEISKYYSFEPSSFKNLFTRLFSVLCFVMFLKYILVTVVLYVFAVLEILFYF